MKQTNQITREELLEKLFHKNYEELKGKKLRLTRVRVPEKKYALPILSILPKPVSIKISVFTSVFTKARIIQARPSV